MSLFLSLFKKKKEKKKKKNTKRQRSKVTLSIQEIQCYSFVATIKEKCFSNPIPVLKSME